MKTFLKKLLTLIVALIFTSNLMAKLIYVNQAATGLNDGTSWANAYTSLQPALDYMWYVNNDEVWVAKGTYYPSSSNGLTNDSRYYHFKIKDNGDNMYGGFAGTETSLDQRTNFGSGEANETILSGDVGVKNFKFDNCYHVVIIDYGNKDYAIDGFTISDGYADGTETINKSGGGMYGSSLEQQLRNITFKNNYASISGGGLYLEKSSYSAHSKLSNCKFIKNTALQNGGGLYVKDAEPLLINCIFQQNSATNGGGIYSLNSNAEFYNALITSNSCGGGIGGGIYFKDGKSRVANSTIVNNSNSDGAGIGFDYGSLTKLQIANSILWGNGDNSAGSQVYGGDVSIYHSCYSNAGFSPTTQTIVDCININPRFVDLANSDYRISGRSPCINAGDNFYTQYLDFLDYVNVTTDLRGKDRIQSTTIDIGAYEWTSGTDTYSNKLYVKYNATGVNDGGNWNNAYTSLQSALDYALTGDEIYVAKGTYYPSSTGDIATPTNRDKHFRLIEGVGMHGGDGGETILSGDIGVLNDSTDNCYHVIYNPTGTNITKNTVFEGFTITEGNANGTSLKGNGGGMHLTNCAPTLNNISFKSNYAKYGGGMYNNASSPTLNNISFVSNNANDGGGMYNSASSPLITKVVFQSNTTSGFGGGLHNTGNSAPTINEASFISNYAGIKGGGIYNSISSPNIKNAVFTLNSSNTYGGAIFNTSSSNLKLTNTTITLNTAKTGGGAIYNSSSLPVINNSIIWNNTSLSGANEIYTIGTFTLNYSCYSNGTNDIDNAGTLIATNQNVTSDPSFINDANENLKLAGNSPCVNTGKNSYNTNSTDLNGEVRIQNDIIDMGAYEWTSGKDPVNRIIYVNQSQTDDTGNGLTWGQAKKTLQAALTSALNTGDQIWIAKGTYYPTSSNDLTNTSRFYHFRMVDGVSIYGGFAGTETALNQRTKYSLGGVNETILSGNIGNPSNKSDNCYHVIYNPAASALTNATLLSSVTITGGNANAASPHDAGGAIYNAGSSAVLRNVIFTNNNAFYGAGAFNQTSTSEYSDCLFFLNYASTGGGAIRNTSANIVLTNCTVSANSAFASGGGIENSASSPVFNNSIIWGNHGATGAQFSNTGSGTVTLNNSCYSNGTGDVSSSNVTFNTTNNNTTQNPLFIDEANNDYRIYRSSPAYNKGNNSYCIDANDIGIRSRIQMNTIDMGAYEWTAGVERNSPNPIIYVDLNAKGNNTGLTWNNAITDLQTAITTAMSGDGIWVAKGTYKPSLSYTSNSNTPRYYSFKFTDGVSLYGGFAGTESTIEQRTNFGFGGINETSLSGDVNGDDIVSGEGATLTISNNAENCYHVFFNQFGGLTISPLLDGFTIRGGNANDSYGGGGAYLDRVSPTFKNIVFFANSGYNGGALNTNSSPIIENSTFMMNNGSTGGAIKAAYSGLSITNTLFKSNKASSTGGACEFSYGTPICTNVVFLSNSATELGGAVRFNRITSAVFTNTSFTLNTSKSGGAVNTLYSDVIFNNSVFWGNTATQGNEIYKLFNSVTLNNSCYSNQSNDLFGTVTANNCTNSDPKFINPIGGDVRLFGNSPCVNTGSNSYNTLSTDIRGKSRIQNTTIDMGAYEWTSGTDPATECENPTNGGTIGSTEIICYNATPSQITSSVLPTGHYGTLEYKWQVSVTSSSSGFSDISNSDSENYSPAIITQPTWYKRMARVNCKSDWTGAAESNVIQLTVRPAFSTGVINVTGETICYNTNPSLIGSSTAASGGDGSITYKWQANGVDIPNSNSETYDPPTVLTNTTTYTRWAKDNTCNGTYTQSTGSWMVTVVPEILYVNANASGLNNGTSWSNAIKSLQSALNTAVNGVAIWVAKGTYKPSSAYDLTNNTSRYYHFRLKEGVKVYGGFAGTETAINQRVSFSKGETNETILSGDIGTIGDYSDNCYHVIYNPAGLNLTQTAVLDGFTVRDGNADGTNPHNMGGGILTYQSSPEISRVTFVSNKAVSGAGLYIYSASSVVNSCLFYNNTATANGGGIAISSNCNPVLNNNTIVSNTAANGGGLMSYSSEAVLNNCIVWSNMANTGKQFYLSAASTVTLNYSDYSNSANDVVTSSSIFITANNNLTTDPQFVNSGNQDFRLYGNSPCVNAANNSYNTLSTDIRGKARIQNTTIDMGAYEWTSGTDPAKNLTTGIENNASNSEMQVYPNPSNGQVNFRFTPENEGRTTIDIYSITGELVYRVFEATVEQGTEQTIQFAKPLAEGLYIYKMTNGNQIKTGRLIRMSK